jgi:hypothetical protein
MSQKKKVYKLRVTQEMVTVVEVVATEEEVTALANGDGPEFHYEAIDKWSETSTEWEISEQEDKDASSGHYHKLDWFISPGEDV